MARIFQRARKSTTSITRTKDTDRGLGRNVCLARAAFYILDGKGYEIHDGVRYDWKAGDIAIVPNNCVHQHFNASDTEPARALVIKTKPMFMFMNMLFQKQLIPRPTTPAPGAEDFSAREEEEDFNHPDEGY